MRLIDLTGQKYGRLSVLRRAVVKMAGGKHVAWECRCECGNETRVTTAHLRSGHTTSCGCFRDDVNGLPHVTHGHVRGGVIPREYSVWCSMKDRCLNPANKAYRSYGGRGITICDRWRDDYAAFLADMGPRPAGTSIDRIDVNGNYEPGNCRWATPTQQANNTRKNIFVDHCGSPLTLKQVARTVGVSYHRLWTWYVELDTTLDEAIRRAQGPARGAGTRRPGLRRKLKTHCIRGHPFTQENTRWYRGVRSCRQCANAHQRARTAGVRLVRPAHAPPTAFQTAS